MLCLSNWKHLQMTNVTLMTRFVFRNVANILLKEKNWLPAFLAPLAVGQRAYVMVRCPSCIRPSIPPCVRPCVNVFFKHLLRWNYLSDFDEISQKCSHHGPLQNFLKLFDSFKNSGCHGNKTENFLKSLKIFLSETIRPRATKFGI